MKKHRFKIRFNTEHAKTDGLYWRVLIDESDEILVSHISSERIGFETISHILPNGDQKWSITCESNNYCIDKDNKLHITE